MPSPYPKIWFLRHGQTEWNKISRLQGHLDSPLTEQGKAEAARQALILPAILQGNPAIWVSPLGRARQTADIALGGAAYQTDPRLKEIDAGAWQGLCIDEILAKHPDLAAQAPTALDVYEAAEGGEGLEAFQRRVADFLGDLAEPTVIVAHGLWGQVLRAHIRGIPFQEAGALNNLQGVVYELEDGAETVLEVPD